MEFAQSHGHFELTKLLPFL